MYYTKKIGIPLYDSFDLYIHICDDIEKQKEVLEEPDRTSVTFACCWKSRHETDWGFSKGISVLFNPNCPGGKITPGVVGHEAVHVKNMIFGAIRHKNSTKSGSDEPEAYFLEWIINTIWDFYTECIEKESKLKINEE